jgi:YspA, cpYpsA-related SLOG family
MRVLVTGSRDWPYPEVVRRELGLVLSAHRHELFTVVHGACNTGVDYFADKWAKDFLTSFGVQCERHPADWDKYGKAAGPIRNQQMADLGADLCLAFRYMGSKGVQDCVNRAYLAGIPVRMLELDLIELKGCK